MTSEIDPSSVETWGRGNFRPIINVSESDVLIKITLGPQPLLAVAPVDIKEADAYRSGRSLVVVAERDPSYAEIE